MAGGFFWNTGTLNYLGQWVEPAGMQANVVSLPYAIPEQLLSAAGRLSFLRVHDVGSCFGAASDSSDLEVLFAVNSQPGKTFGFQLRGDDNEGDHVGMLNLLRAAFRENRTVRIDYRPGLPNATVIRVEKLD